MNTSLLSEFRSDLILYLPIGEEPAQHVRRFCDDVLTVPIDSLGDWSQVRTWVYSELIVPAIKALGDAFAAHGCGRSLDYPARYIYSINWIPGNTRWVLPNSKYANGIRHDILKPLAYQRMYWDMLNAPAVTHDMTSVYSVVTAGQLRALTVGEVGELARAISDHTWRSYLSDARAELWHSTSSTVTHCIAAGFPGLPDIDLIRDRWFGLSAAERAKIVQIAASIAGRPSPVSFNDCLSAGYDPGIAALVYVILQDAGIVAPCDYARAIKVRS